MRQKKSEKGYKKVWDSYNVVIQRTNVYKVIENEWIKNNREQRMKKNGSISILFLAFLVSDSMEEEIKNLKNGEVVELFPLNDWKNYSFYDI